MQQSKISEISSNHSINLALDTLKKEKQAIIFVNTKRSAEKTAEEISKKLKTKKQALFELSRQILSILSTPTAQCRRLSLCIEKGIAFHHAGLNAGQRDIIEESFKKGLIKIICATPTLAAGVDLPAFRTILRDLKRYTQRGLTPIPVLEYMQMAGRAGRPKFDNFGEAIIVSSSESEKDKLYERYILGEPEEIYSKLAVEPVLRTYLLSLIASDFVNTKKQILDFFSKTFWAFQFEDMHHLEQIISKMLNLLDKWDLIRFSSKKDFVSADELAGEKIKTTLLGKRTAELYIDPLTANYILKCLEKTEKRSTIPFSFIQAVSHTIEMRPLLKTKIKEYDDIQESLAKYQIYILDQEPSLYDPEYEDFINSVKTALFIHDWIEEKNEEYLLETYDIRPGEIRAKLDIADWLLYTSEELARIKKMQPLIKELKKLRLRIKHGAKQELIPLLKLKNIGRVRARKLYNNNIKDIKDIHKADFIRLVQLLGKNTALNIKKQVGQDFSKIKVKENKRKGQISLNDF